MAIRGAWVLQILLLIVVTYFCTPAENKTVLFGNTTTNFTVLEGDTVTMVCNTNSPSTVDVFTSQNYIAQTGNLTGSSNEFEFDCNETSCSTTIIEIEKKHTSKYNCLFPEQSLVIDVMYSPSKVHPFCSSNYGSYVFFLDSLQEQFNFTCISEKGNPMSTMALYLDYEHGEKIIPMNVTTFRSNDSHVLLAYSPYLDASFDGATLICTVSQQLRDYPNFKRSCSFGPLKLPIFSVSIHQYYGIYNLTKTEIITLNCASNVSGVTLEWTYIPLDDWQYNISRIDGSLELNIFNYKSSTDESLFECSGYYGRRNISELARINLRGYLEQQWLFPDLSLILTGVALLTWVTTSIMIVAGIKLYQFRTKRNKFILRAGSPSPVDRLTSCHSTGDANFNNTRIDEISGDNNENMEMTDNPIYGSYGHRSKIIPNVDIDISGSGSGMEMTENVIYESYKQETSKLHE